MIPHLVFFDVDNTLTESKQPLSARKVELMTELLRHTKVAITSGAKIALITHQIPDQLPEEVRSNLYMLPASGSALYEYKDGEWKAVYEDLFTPEEVEEVRAAFLNAGTDTGLIDFNAPSVGERIEWRGSEMALTAPGQEAPIDVKAAWDPDRSKRMKLREVLLPLLPNYEVRIAGRSTIDVTKKGIDKAYGVQQISQYLNIPIADMIYIGDALYPGGNDEVVKKSGIKTHQVKDPKETEQLMETLLAS
ncbi:HAD-IIB family hydrolase [Patescibacteria group bacterium]|nr:HAD-IIB family hydrolase [Patescibacteria group bacterium]